MRLRSRIRYYGLLGNRHHNANLALCRNLLSVSAIPGELEIQVKELMAQ
jgi:hypothetical protein